MGKEKKAVTKTSDIVTGAGTAKTRHRFSKKAIIIFVAITIVILLVIGVGLKIFFDNRNEVKQAESNANKLAGTTKTEKVNSGVASGKYDETLTYINDQPDSDSHENMSAVASIYFTQQNYDAALKQYQAIDAKYDLSRSDAAYAGYAAEQLKRYDEAVTYFKLAKKIIDETGQPIQKQQYGKEYQRKIDELSQK